MDVSGLGAPALCVSGVGGEGDSSVANSLPGGGRRPLLAGDENDQLMIHEWQAQAMQPIKEDLVLWINKTLGGDEVTSEDFMGCLDNGVALCRLAEIIQQRENEADATNSSQEGGAKAGKLRYRPNATSGTWFARDNTAAFLQWCKEKSVKEECMFETEGLVLHRSERNVILCLLELARLGMKHGLEPPSLIKLEADIDQLEASQHLTSGEDADQDVFDGDSADSAAGNMNGGNDGTDGAGKGEELRTTRAPVKNDAVDRKVVEMMSTCSCTQCFQVVRLSEGRYKIGGRNMFVRLLQDRHLMVRVGGGWDTLEHYLNTHDPCRIIEFKRSGLNQRQRNDKLKGEDADFVQARGRYKSAGQRRKGSVASK